MVLINAYHNDQCRVNGEDTRLMLWDTAGQEEFDAITKAYYRGNAGSKVAVVTSHHSPYPIYAKYLPPPPVMSYLRDKGLILG